MSGKRFCITGTRNAFSGFEEKNKPRIERIKWIGIRLIRSIRGLFVL
jgi:hypothetical protein